MAAVTSSGRKGGSSARSSNQTLPTSGYGRITSWQAVLANGAANNNDNETGNRHRTVAIDNDDHNNNGSNARRDIDAVSKIVTRKLDTFLHDIKREQSFDPTGGRRIQSAGYNDYSAIRWVEGEQDSGYADRARSAAVVPRLPTRSGKSPRASYASNQAARLNKYATCLLDSHATRNIEAIRRVRLSTDKNDEETLQPVAIQNFRLHFGTALTIDKYLSFYEQRGYSGGKSRQRNMYNSKSRDVRSAATERQVATDPRFSAIDQRLLDSYCRKCNTDLARLPRYLESSWDVSASVRHQMRTFTVNEIRRLRHQSTQSNTNQARQHHLDADASTVRVLVDEDDDDRQADTDDLDLLDLDDKHSTTRHHHGDVDDRLLSPKHRFLRELPGTRWHHGQESDATSGEKTSHEDPDVALCDVSSIDPEDARDAEG